MIKNKKPILLTFGMLILNMSANADTEIYMDKNYIKEFNNNTVDVNKVDNILKNNSSMVNEIKFDNSINKKEDSFDQRYNSLINKHCGIEKEIFCKNNNELDTQVCLKSNIELITGNCLQVLKVNNNIKNKGLILNDLNLPLSTEFIEKINVLGEEEYKYKINEEFKYRNLIFKEGIITVRNYKESEFKGQYIISSGYPKTLFTDDTGAKFNPKNQKGPFFFNKDGLVSVGTLQKPFEYKKFIFLKPNSIIAFDKERNLLQGTLFKDVRIGGCDFRRDMQITDEKINYCTK